KAIILKYVMITVILWLVLGAFYGAAIGQVLLLSAIITGVSFILGDLFILSKFENWGAVLADFFIVLLAVWLYSSTFIMGSIPSLNAAAFSAIFISIGEVFFHKYVDKHILNIDDRTGGRGPEDVGSQLQTEFSKEMDTPDPPEDR